MSRQFNSTAVRKEYEAMKNDKARTHKRSLSTSWEIKLLATICITLAVAIAYCMITFGTVPQ